MHNKENTKEADEIFERILEETEQQGKKYAELIEFLDLPRGTFSAWKAGRSRNFCEHLCAISEFLNVDVGWLASGNRAESPVNVKETELLEAFRKLSGKAGRCASECKMAGRMMGHSFRKEKCWTRNSQLGCPVTVIKPHGGMTVWSRCIVSDGNKEGK